MSEKKTTFSNLSSQNRDVARQDKIGHGRNKVYNDNLTSHARRVKKISDAANGKWWIKQYLLGNMNYQRPQFEEE
jgi:hypothetical protein